MSKMLIICFDVDYPISYWLDSPHSINYLVRGSQLPLENLSPCDNRPPQASEYALVDGVYVRYARRVNTPTESQLPDYFLLCISAPCVEYAEFRDSNLSVKFVIQNFCIN